MLLCFTLSMPNVGSWNGRWSGEGILYAKIIDFGRGKKGTERAEKILEKGYFHYSFSDGWSAGVTVKKVFGQEVRRIRRQSKGFCGYEWMIESIRRHGDIRLPERVNSG